MQRIFLIIALFFILATQVVWGQIPQTISYQGVLTDASGIVVPDGSYGLTFKLYDLETGGTALWLESHPSAVVKDGVFNVILGKGDPENPLNVAFDKSYWLEITVEGSVLIPFSVDNEIIYA